MTARRSLSVFGDAQCIAVLRRQSRDRKPTTWSRVRSLIDAMLRKPASAISFDLAGYRFAVADSSWHHVSAKLNRGCSAPSCIFVAPCSCASRHLQSEASRRLTTRSTRTPTGGAARLGGRRLPWFVRRHRTDRGLRLLLPSAVPIIVPRAPYVSASYRRIGSSRRLTRRTSRESATLWFRAQSLCSPVALSSLRACAGFGNHALHRTGHLARWSVFVTR